VRKAGSEGRRKALIGTSWFLWTGSALTPTNRKNHSRKRWRTKSGKKKVKIKERENVGKDHSLMVQGGKKSWKGQRRLREKSSAVKEKKIPRNGGFLLVPTSRNRLRKYMRPPKIGGGNYEA